MHARHRSPVVGIQRQPLALAAPSLTALCCLLALGCSRDARGVAQDSTRAAPAGAGAEARTRYLAAFGVMSGVLFVLVDLAEWVPTIILGPCQRA